MFCIIPVFLNLLRSKPRLEEIKIATIIMIMIIIALHYYITTLLYGFSSIIHKCDLNFTEKLLFMRVHDPCPNMLRVD